MNIALEKEKIKSALDEVNDEHLLRAIKEMLSFAQSTKFDFDKAFASGYSVTKFKEEINQRIKSYPWKK